MLKMEKHERYESKCPKCLYYDICNKTRRFDCDHYLDACDEYAWHEDHINEDRQIFSELWYKYANEYCD